VSKCKNVSKCKTKGAGKKKPVKSSVIASRKSCSATGTGLSHYILTDRKAK
jgi:modified peptide precursor CbpA